MKDQHKKIKGYRELSQAEIDMMNKIKAKGAELGELVAELQAAEGFDQRAIAIGKTELQTGLMWLTRGVAQPESF
ncbi:Acb2/Tad1 domain-containing protein [Psychrobacter celer]|uniref:Acb2/Tad1 domain-containing protein n=1 Tax=Psychrobacter celer TaxID=306572 RepID=UPI003FCF3F8F